MPSWPVPASNDILVAGVPLEMEFEAYGDIYPGDTVQFASGTCKVEPGADESVGIIGIADLSVGSYDGNGTRRDLPYEAGDQVKVIRGPIIVMLRLAAAAEVVCGEFLKPAASGEVDLFACGTDNDCKRIAQALESPAVDTTAFQWILAALERPG